MREYGVLFKAPMVNAILAERKRMTRRLPPKPVPEGISAWHVVNDPKTGRWGIKFCRHDTDIECCDESVVIWSRYGGPGDLWYVKETWATIPNCEGQVYRADGPHDGVQEWHPSLFMPKARARIWLRVTALTAQRLNDITWPDIRSEGVDCPEHDFPGGFCCSECPSLRMAWVDLWNSINKKKAPWKNNPLVFVYTFERARVAQGEKRWTR
jgi:hypothetical protein